MRPERLWPQPTTLETAIAKVVTGDAIILRGGTYRTGGLRFNQGITMQPYADERPVLKGTRVATEWQGPAQQRLADVVEDALSGRAARLVAAGPRGHADAAAPLQQRHGLRRRRDAAGPPAGRASSTSTRTTSTTRRDRSTSASIPTNRLVEITAFDGALIRTTAPVHGKTNDHKGPVIRGITFTQYAWRALEIEGKRSFGPDDEPTDEPVGPADPATYGKEVTGTTLENVTISFCSRVAGYFRGDGLALRNSLFSDTSTEGVYVIGSSDVLLEKNIFRRNNVEELTGYYPAAVKIFNQSHRVTCRDNLVMDNPNSNGIWYDVGNLDGVFVNNWVEDALDGFFFEISKGAIVAGNVFVNCDKGIRVLNSSNVRVYHNTLVNSVASFERNERSATGDHFGWHPATGPGRGQARGPRLRGQPPGRERAVPQAAPALRAAEGALRASSPGRRSRAGRQRLRARRRASGPARGVEPGRRRELPGRARLARGAAEAAAGGRGARARSRATTPARSSGAPSCAATSWRGRCRPGLAPARRPAGRGGEAPRLAGGPAADPGCLPAATAAAPRATCGGR